jgi:hypothetical protein
MDISPIFGSGMMCICFGGKKNEWRKFACQDVHWSYPGACWYRSGILCNGDLEDLCPVGKFGDEPVVFRFCWNGIIPVCVEFWRPLILSEDMVGQLGYRSGFCAARWCVFLWDLCPAGEFGDEPVVFRLCWNGIIPVWISILFVPVRRHGKVKRGVWSRKIPVIYVHMVVDWLNWSWYVKSSIMEREVTMVEQETIAIAKTMWSSLLSDHIPRSPGVRTSTVIYNSSTGVDKSRDKWRRGGNCLYLHSSVSCLESHLQESIDSLVPSQSTVDCVGVASCWGIST